MFPSCCHPTSLHKDTQVPTLCLPPHLSWDDNRSEVAFEVQHHLNSGLGWEENFAVGLVLMPQEEHPKDELLLEQVLNPLCFLPKIRIKTLGYLYRLGQCRRASRAF